MLVTLFRGFPDLNSASSWIKLLDFTKESDDKANEQVRGVTIKVFVSPTDTEFKPGSKTGPTSYLLIAGSKNSLEDNDGLFYRDSKTKFTDIADGTSNTLFSVETLLGEGHEVIVLDDLSTGRAENLQAVLGHAGLSFVEGSVTDEALVEKLLPAELIPDPDPYGRRSVEATIPDTRYVAAIDAASRTTTGIVTTRPWKT